MVFFHDLRYLHHCHLQRIEPLPISPKATPADGTASYFGFSFWRICRSQGGDTVFYLYEFLQMDTYTRTQFAIKSMMKSIQNICIYIYMYIHVSGFRLMNGLT